ncbi:MAG: sulfatase-like hydrolase/transferase [Eisenbergiella sp.]
MEKSCEKEQPFFLYYALHQPHVPRVPSKRFQGATKLGARGDVIAEMDWCIGELLDKLEELGIREEERS